MILKKFFKNIEKSRTQKQEVLRREQLEKRAVEGAKKAVREYRRVFERLSEYDRT